MNTKIPYLIVSYMYGMPEPHFCTYLLVDPRDEIPFYVGKGIQKRMYAHDAKSQNQYVRDRVSEIKSLGLKLIYEKWFESDDEDFCYWMEIYIIDYFGLDSLCNMNLGGYGPPSGDLHPSKDPKFRAFMSGVHKGKVGPKSKFKKGSIPWSKTNRHLMPVPWNKGKKFPERSGENHPRFGKRYPEQSGENHHLFGKHLSDEVRQKISVSLKGKFVGEDHPRFGKHHTEEANRKNREAHIGLMAGEKHHMFGKHHSAESLQKISESRKGKTAWNKGRKCPERSGVNHPMFGKAYPTPWNKGLHHTEESNQKNRAAHLGKPPWNKGKKCPELSGVNNPMFGKHPVSSFKGRHHTEESKRKIGARFLEKITQE
jgi:hypothetical protein